MYISGKKPLMMLRFDPYMAWSFYCTSALRVLYGRYSTDKLRLKHYAGNTVVSQVQGNEILKSAIENGTPYMFGRNGTNELSIVSEWICYQNGITDTLDINNFELRFIESGLFPLSQDTMEQFSDIILNAQCNVNLYGTFRMVLEDYFIKRYMPSDVKLTHLNMMDFWRYDEPFTCKLEGKKVVIVHPLADMIVSQYENRKRLFTNPSVLPEFTLRTFQAVQTVGGERDSRFDSWFEALDYMTEEISKIDFDIALLGCGAYGMPLASRIKDMGKISIYMGGVLQMLFGIKGKRWDKIHVASALYNDYWKYPEEKFVPKQSYRVEGGCYW